MTMKGKKTMSPGFAFVEIVCNFVLLNNSIEMKRILALVFALGMLSFFASAQDRIHTFDGNIINCSVLRIGGGAVVYNDAAHAGEQMHLDTAEVAYITFQDGSVRTFSDDFTIPSSIFVQNGILYGDRVEIPKGYARALLGNDAYKNLRSGMGLKSAGTVLLISGGAATVCGGLLLGTKALITKNLTQVSENRDNTADIVGYSLLGAGAVCMLASVPMLIIGNKKIAEVTSDYNGRAAFLSLGSTPCGIGVALTF